MTHLLLKNKLIINCILWSIPTCLATAAFVNLGLWQLHRAEWKAALIENDHQARLTTAIDLNTILRLGNNLATVQSHLQHQLLTTNQANARRPIAISATGYFDPQKTILLDNQTVDGQVGVMVYSVFSSDHASPAILVNRGWVAINPDRTLTQTIVTPTETLRIDGFIVPPPAVGIALPNPPLTQTKTLPKWLHLDIEDLSRQWHLPLFGGIVQLSPQSPAGYLRQWQVLPNTIQPEQHRGYAIQWFGLALATFIIYIILIIRQIRKT